MLYTDDNIIWYVIKASRKLNVFIKKRLYRESLNLVIIEPFLVKVWL